MEKEKKAQKAKKKKNKPNLVINIIFFTLCTGHQCRHKKEEGKGVKTPVHNVGESDSDMGRADFGPGSKGVPD